ncbi:MAG TPA: DUF5996 family protein, partial [Polyangia bacterium]
MTIKDQWPPLPLASWRDTQATLHRCTQIPGKIALALRPRVNHFWNVALQLTPRGLTTGPLPLAERTFGIDFDFVDHGVVVRTSDGATRALVLEPRPVADFYRDLQAALAGLGIRVPIHDHPVEILSEVIPLHEDRLHAAYDQDAVARWWRIVAQSAVVLEEFRARFVGKCSPVHFFWGSFDLAVSRYSGRRAPARPGADPVTREAYSHETSSVGFWPGDERYPDPAYYAYFAPVPAGYEHAAVRPAAAFWHPEMRELILPYDAVRTAASPREALLEFTQSTYDAGAELARWNR